MLNLKVAIDNYTLSKDSVIPIVVFDLSSKVIYYNQKTILLLTSIKTKTFKNIFGELLLKIDVRY